MIRDGKEAIAVNRDDLQQLARERIRDAKALLGARRWSGAYYLAGYAVECGLKACVIVHLMRTDEFPERRFSEQCWTHNLEQLLDLAGLKAIMDVDRVVDLELFSNWAAVRRWKESSRYSPCTRSQALELYEAITDKKHGVLPWIKARW